jgi:hypothetical protein
MDEKVSKSKKNQIANLIKSNCENYYGRGPIPSAAYFLSSDNEGKKILEMILIESDFDISRFSSKAAEAILSYNKQDISYTTRYLKQEQELKETTSYLNSVSYRSSEPSRISFRLIKTRSSLGPVSVDVKVSESEARLNTLESSSFEISITSIAEVKITVNEGVKVRILETFSIFFKELSNEGLDQLKTSEIEKIIEKKNEEFEAKIEVKIFLGQKDKISLLEKKINEIKKGLLETNVSGIIYNDLIQSLELFHDVDSGQFKSLIRPNRQNRETCCGPCIVI